MRYILQKSKEGPPWWVLTDTQMQLVCKFKEGDFNDSQQFTPLEEGQGVTALASAAREMTDWLVENYPEIVFWSPVRIKEEARRDLGEEIRAAREAAGYTLRELAKVTGIAFNHISRIEQGRYNVTLDTLALIANALGMQIGLFEV